MGAPPFTVTTGVTPASTVPEIPLVLPRSGETTVFMVMAGAVRSGPLTGKTGRSADLFALLRLPSSRLTTRAAPGDETSVVDDQ